MLDTPNMMSCSPSAGPTLLRSELPGVRKRLMNAADTYSVSKVQLGVIHWKKCHAECRIMPRVSSCGT